ncbi:MAG: cell division protein FtsL [Stellaceae bacterium]
MVAGARPATGAGRMIKLSTLFWLILVSATGFAMFAVKYEVQALADQLVHTTKKAAEVEHEVRVLDADWAYLNRPAALAQMNQRYLSLAPIATKQLYASVTEIPMRPAPPPPVEMVAAVGPASSQTPQPTPGAGRPQPSQATQDGSPEESSPAQGAAAVVTAALEPRLAAPEPVRPAPIKTAFRPRPPHRARSLDALIAQIAESR